MMVHLSVTRFKKTHALKFRKFLVLKCHNNPLCGILIIKVKSYLLIFILVNLLNNYLLSQTIISNQVYSFNNWLKTQNSIEKLNRINTNLSNEIITYRDTFYTAKNISFENIFFRLAKYYYLKGEKEKLESTLILAAKNGADIKEFNLDHISKKSLKSINYEYNKYLKGIKVKLRDKISQMVDLDQSVRITDSINYRDMKYIDSINQYEFKKIIIDLNKWPGSNEIGRQLKPYIFVQHTMNESEVLFFLNFLIVSCQNGLSSWSDVVSILSHRLLRLKSYEDGSKKFLFIDKNKDLEDLEIHSIAYILHKLPKLKVTFCIIDMDLATRILEKLSTKGISKERITISKNFNNNSYKVYF